VVDNVPKGRAPSVRVQRLRSWHELCRDSGKANDLPMQAASTGGSGGYAGYEYQKAVTVWLSLELMIAKAVTDSITVEPRSHEDIEAALQSPDSKSRVRRVRPAMTRADSMRHTPSMVRWKT
jgi:hypothetical protein